MSIKDKKRVGVAFGVFDGLHKGHERFLDEALKLCRKLVVVLTLPETVMTLKGHKPRFSYDERAKAINVLNAKIRVLPGDKKLGYWTIFRNSNLDHKSSIVILGYDQKDIARELEKMGIAFITLPSYHPDKYKSSLL